MASQPRFKKIKSLSSRRWIIMTLGVTISLVCLTLAFRKMNWSHLVTEILAVHIPVLISALVLVNLHNFVLAKRWHLLLKPLGAISYWNAFWSLRISFFFNATLPARLGEPFRIFYVTRASKISAARGVGAMASDRFVDFITMIGLLYISAVVLGLRGTLPKTETIIGASLIFVGVFTALARLPRDSRFRWLHKFFQIRAKIFEGIKPLRNWKTLLPCLFLSTLGWLIEALIIASFARGFDCPISIFKALMVVATVNVAIAIPSTPGHIGTFELGAIAMMTFFEIDQSKAAAIAIMYHMVQLIPTVLIGAYGYYFQFLKHFSLRGSKENPIGAALDKAEQMAHFEERLDKKRSASTRY